MTKFILIVDDERHVRTLLERTLDPFEDIDVQLLIASSAEDALEKARDHRPSLAFVDVSMPDSSGYDLCALLRSLPGGDALAIVLLFDMGQRPDEAKCKALCVEQCVGKPFDPDRIRLLTGRVLGVDVEL